MTSSCTEEKSRWFTYVLT